MFALLDIFQCVFSLDFIGSICLSVGSGMLLNKKKGNLCYAVILLKEFSMRETEREL